MNSRNKRYTEVIQYNFIIVRKNDKYFEIKRNNEVITSARSYSKVVKKVRMMNKAFDIGYKEAQDWYEYCEGIES